MPGLGHGAGGTRGTLAADAPTLPPHPSVWPKCAWFWGWAEPGVPKKGPKRGTRYCWGVGGGSGTAPARGWAVPHCTEPLLAPCPHSMELCPHCISVFSSPCGALVLCPHCTKICPHCEEFSPCCIGALSLLHKCFVPVAWSFVLIAQGFVPTAWSFVPIAQMPPPRAQHRNTEQVRKPKLAAAASSAQLCSPKGIAEASPLPPAPGNPTGAHK